MTPFRVDCLAMCDVEEARRYYEQQRSGLGREFADAVAATFRRIAVNPLLHGSISGDYRKCRVKGFPYGVIYRLKGDELVILVVFHLHRRPGFWKPRVKVSE